MESWLPLKKAKLRAKKLVIPPAWKNVIINPDPLGHIQAIGTDKKGRKQYIYHPKWIEKSQETKFDDIISFGEKLPLLRHAVQLHMKEKGLSQNRVVATVIWLLEHTFIRVGNKEYALENESYGLTTMREKHIVIRGDKISFSFMGKSGIYHELNVSNSEVAKTIKECIDLPGYELFKYIDDDNNKRIVSSEEVNTYMKEYTGGDFSAKDFRTWGASVLAGDYLYKKGQGENEKVVEENIKRTVEEVSKHLGNTQKVCRKYYIHPVIIDSYEKDILVPHFKRSLGRKSSIKLSLSPIEYATWSLIKDS